jgi:hypothetical protein
MKAFLVIAFFLYSKNVYAFCGFYVAQAGGKLFNKSSQVVIVRDENKTVLTMMSDYQGDPKEFAMVVPVPEVLKREQINITAKEYVEHLDTFTAPRLVEYFDPDPCVPEFNFSGGMADSFAQGNTSAMSKTFSGGSNKVKIEAKYEIGQYDILILSATESSGLVDWLMENKYKVEKTTQKILEEYIKNNLKFFVAKINLERKNSNCEGKKTTTDKFTLCPIQIAFESNRFSLPIRLGTINAKEDQDLIVHTITKNGRVESSNYPTVKIPTDFNVPPNLKSNFGNFYKDLFSFQKQNSKEPTVYLEYAWGLDSCDPCPSEPPSNTELRKLGVFWLKSDEDLKNQRFKGGFLPFEPKGFVTRLHVRYNKETFPEDLTLQKTSNEENYQVRIVMNHPFDASKRKLKIKHKECSSQMVQYQKHLSKRRGEERENLKKYAGWGDEKTKDLFQGLKIEEETKKSWYEDLWR